MNPLVLWLIDGKAFVVCSFICLGCFAWMGIGRRIPPLKRAIGLALLAALLIPATATPLPPLLLLAPAVFCALGVIVLRKKSIPLRLLRTCGVLGFCISTPGLVAELRWSTRPILTGDYAGVIVVGDSLSAGIQATEMTWPAVLEEQVGVKVSSVARPGARIRDGVRQIADATIGRHVVIILLGGNDMLGGIPPETFRAELEMLIRAVRARGAQPLVIEFPAMPFHQGYGRAMRAVATAHSVPLLHRRHLSSVFGKSGSTMDGLHLSESGHRNLAQAVSPSLRLDRNPEGSD